MTYTSELKGTGLTLVSSANTANTASLSISEDKIVTLGGTNTYFPPVDNDLICTITPRTTGTNLATLTEINSTGVYGYTFPNNALKEVSWLVQLDHTWQEGSSIVPHTHWCPSSANTSNVVFNLDYWVANINTTIPSVATLTANGVPSGTAFQHQITYFPSITMTGNTASCILGGRLYRDGGAGDDAFTGSAYILGIDIHVKRDRWGKDV